MAQAGASADDPRRTRNPRPFSESYRLLPYVVYAAAVLHYAGASPYSLYDFPLDDAWIHRVYSSSFAHGHGFAYNPGTQEAGSTSPGWTILTAPAQWLEPFGPEAVVVSVKLITVALGVLLLATIQAIGRVVLRTPVGGSIAATLFALDPRFLFSLLSGMETILLVALWVRGAYAYAAGRRLQSLAWFALAPVTRPEAAVLLPLWLAGRWLLDRGQRPTLVEHLLWLAAWTPMGLWSLFCLYANGHWLPNTFYLKAHSRALGGSEVWQAVEIVGQHGYTSLRIFLVGLAVLVVWTAVRARRAGSVLLWHLLLMPLVYAVAVAGSRALVPTGYYWTRWVDPASLVLTVAFGLSCGIAAVETARVVPSLLRGGRDAPWRHWCLVGATAAAIIWLVVLTPRFAVSFAERRGRMASDSRAIHLMNVVPGKWIRDHTPAGARIGVNDAGAIRYFGERWTLDLIGLNSGDIAFRRRKFTPADIDWLAIFPTAFAESPMMEHFVRRQEFVMPVEEYTVCPCYGQNHVEILERADRPDS